jgi:inner membrane protein YidH
MMEPAASVPSSEANTELSMRRTGMSFQRTRMSADRTLMSVIRTSLSLISFGFTIYQIFRKLRDAGVLRGTADARHFGLTLVLLGVGMLILGIVYHLLFMRGLRLQRDQMKAAGLIHAQSGFPASLTLIIAVLLLLVGVVAAVSIVSRNAPYG